MEWPKCQSAKCDVEEGGPGLSLASLVWPGQGRIYYCAVHWSQALRVLDALSIDPGTCDVRLTAREMGVSR